MRISISKRARGLLQGVAALLVVALVAYFFRDQFARNWDQMRGFHLTPSYPHLVASLLSIALSYIILTGMWRLAANTLARGRPFTYAASIGMVNTTQLTKYIPGKVWGYAMQMVLVDRSSLSISAVLYVNLLIAVSNSFIALLAGGLYFSFWSHLVPRVAALGATAALALLYGFFILFSARFFSLLLRLIQRVLRRTIEPFELGLGTVLRLQGLALAASFAFGISAVLGSLGAGLGVDRHTAGGVFAGFLFADTVGFLAVIVPGGIGVREGLFYLVLAEHGAGSLALILPLVMRVISMLVDALLGLLGLVALRTYVKEGTR